MKRILVVTENEYLGQKIRLTFGESAEVVVANRPVDDFDLCFWDLDSINDEPPADKTVTMSKKLPSDLPLPCSFRAILACLPTEEPTKLSLRGRICHLRGEKIKLTELEAALLSKLIFAEGGFVSREKILSEVWGGGADVGIINVYIHYLREKLERGEKIIISSRNEGYAIDKKYLGGDKNA